MGANQHIQETEPDRLRWYTRARRIPKLIGKTASGEHLPGGPYTVTQFVGGALVLVGMNFTRPLWGGNGLGDYLVIALVATVVVIALKFVRTAGRNPALVIAGRAAGIIAPSYGRQGGAPIKTPRGQKLTSRVNVDLAPASLTRTPSPAAAGSQRFHALVPRRGAPSVPPIPPIPPIPVAADAPSRPLPNPRRQILTVRSRPAHPNETAAVVTATSPSPQSAPLAASGRRTRLEQLVAAATEGAS